MPYRAPTPGRLPLPPLPPMPEVVAGGYPHLGRLASALGVAHRGSPALYLDLERVRIVLCLRLSSGHVVGIDLEVLAGPYPKVTLRPETDADREAKRRGTSRELQLDDAEFDPRVYVESDASDDTLREMLESADVRAAAVAILDARCPEISFSAGGITLALKGDNEPESPAFEPTRLRAIVENARVLAAAARLRDSETASRRPRRLIVLALVGVLLCAGYVGCLLAMSQWLPLSAWLLAVGVGAGLVLWLALRPLLRLAVRGRSDSHARYRWAQGAALIGCVELGLASSVFVNGAFGKNLHELRGRIASVEGHDEEDSSAEAKVVWEEGSETTETILETTERAVVGGEVVMPVGDGALGFKWKQSRARLATIAP